MVRKVLHTHHLLEWSGAPQEPPPKLTLPQGTGNWKLNCCELRPNHPLPALSRGAAARNLPGGTAPAPALALGCSLLRRYDPSSLGAAPWAGSWFKPRNPAAPPDPHRLPRRSRGWGGLTPLFALNDPVCSSLFSRTLVSLRGRHKPFAPSISFGEPEPVRWERRRTSSGALRVWPSLTRSSERLSHFKAPLERWAGCGGRGWPTLQGGAQTGVPVGYPTLQRPRGTGRPLVPQSSSLRDLRDQF